MTIRTITLFLAAMLLPLSAFASGSSKEAALLLDYGQDVELESYKDVSIRARCLRTFKDRRVEPSPESAEVSMYPQCETELVTQEGGEFTRQGSCGRGMDSLIIYATTENRALLRGRNNYLSGNRGYLTPRTPPRRSRLLQIVAPSGQERFDNDGGKGWVIDAETLEGLEITGPLAILGLNPYGHDGCFLNVDLDKVSKPKKAKGGFLFEEDEDEGDSPE